MKFVSRDYEIHYFFLWFFLSLRFYLKKSEKPLDFCILIWYDYSGLNYNSDDNGDGDAYGARLLEQILNNVFINIQKMTKASVIKWWRIQRSHLPRRASARLCLWSRGWSPRMANWKSRLNTKWKNPKGRNMAPSPLALTVAPAVGAFLWPIKIFAKCIDNAISICYY